jgi:hypothetical protein
MNETGQAARCMVSWRYAPRVKAGRKPVVRRLGHFFFLCFCWRRPAKEGWAALFAGMGFLLCLTALATLSYKSNARIRRWRQRNDRWYRKYQGLSLSHLSGGFGISYRLLAPQKVWAAITPRGDGAAAGTEAVQSGAFENKAWRVAKPSSRHQRTA